MPNRGNPDMERARLGDTLHPAVMKRQVRGPEGERHRLLLARFEVYPAKLLELSDRPAHAGDKVAGVKLNGLVGLDRTGAV